MYHTMLVYNNSMMNIYQKCHMTMIQLIMSLCRYNTRKRSPNGYRGPWWSGLYGSWINNYLCDQRISPLKL